MRDRNQVTGDRTWEIGDRERKWETGDGKLEIDS